VEKIGMSSDTFEINGFLRELRAGQLRMDILAAVATHANESLTERRANGEKRFTLAVGNLASQITAFMKTDGYSATVDILNEVRALLINQIDAAKQAQQSDLHIATLDGQLNFFSAAHTVVFAKEFREVDRGQVIEFPGGGQPRTDLTPR
jgi:hypothetical protein